MKVIKKPLAELRRPDRNVRMHTDKQLKEFRRSVEMFGQIRPIVVDEDGVILAGNGLYETLLSLGRTEADCYVVSGLTEAEKKKLMLADNRVYELGITDIDAFEDIVRSLGDDTDIPGWDADLISALNATPQEVDDFVSGYGAFDPTYTDKIKETKPAPATVPPAPAVNPYAAPSTQLQQPSQPIDTGNPISTTPSAPPTETGNAGQIERYIICPKCGERICL